MATPPSLPAASHLWTRPLVHIIMDRESKWRHSFDLAKRPSRVHYLCCLLSRFQKWHSYWVSSDGYLTAEKLNLELFSASSTHSCVHAVFCEWAFKKETDCKLKDLSINRKIQTNQNILDLSFLICIFFLFKCCLRTSVMMVFCVFLLLFVFCFSLFVFLPTFRCIPKKLNFWELLVPPLCRKLSASQ